MKKSSLITALIAAVPTLASAAAPIAFGGFTSVGGVIDNTVAGGLCAAGSGFECSSAPITDTGFMQQQVTETATGKTYFQTIIADPASGGFASEGFTTTGSVNGGLAAKQSIGDVATGTTGMASDTTLMTGEFQAMGEKKAIITQSVWNEGGTNAASDFQADFSVAMGMVSGAMQMDLTLTQKLGDATGNGTGQFSDNFALVQSMDETNGIMLNKKIDIDSAINLGTGLTDATFAFNSREGTSLAPAAGTGTLGGATVAWVDGDIMTQVLIGQTVAGAGDFGFENLDNASDAVMGLTYTSLATQGGTATATFVDDLNAAVADPFL